MPPPWPWRPFSGRVLSFGRAGQIALVLQLLDDPLDELVETLFGVLGLLPVLAEQLLERLVREHAAVEDRLQDGIVQRLHRMPRFVVVVGQAVRAVEAAREQQVGQPREQILEIELVEVLAGELGVAILHLAIRLLSSSCLQRSAVTAL